MRIRHLAVLLLLCCSACKNTNKEKTDDQEKFDKVKWGTKKDDAYPYRDKILDDLIANVKLHGLKKDSVENLLGEPSRRDSGHLFYLIKQDRFGGLVVHTKTLVIKLRKDSTVEWRKIHQ